MEGRGEVCWTDVGACIVVYTSLATGGEGGLGGSRQSVVCY